MNNTYSHSVEKRFRLATYLQGLSLKTHLENISIQHDAKEVLFTGRHLINFSN